MPQRWRGQPEDTRRKAALLDIEEQEEDTPVGDEGTDVQAEETVGTPVEGMSVSVEVDTLVPLD